MPGIPTKFVIAEKVLKTLTAAGDPQAAVLSNADNIPFYYLGAIGAAFGDFVAARPEIGAAAPNSPYFQVWFPVLQMFAGTPAQGATPATGGVYKDLKQLRDTVNKLDGIVKKAVNGNAAQKDIQKIALVNMKDELTALNAVITDLQNTVATLAAVRVTIGQSIFKSRPSPKTTPSNAWQVRDTLHESHTGQFLRAVHELATNDQQKAYALGATVGHAADVCGNPFVNNIVGAPYRNHWWRHRWISNYVDSWVHGYYGLGGANAALIQSNGVPNPLYANWPNVCAANLQARIELPGLSVDTLFNAVSTGAPASSVLPGDFVEFWQKAFNKAYGPPAGTSVASDPANIQSAFAMLWLILWIQTSGQAIPCVPSDQIVYPDGCGARPPWVAVDGSVTTGNGTVAQPPPPSEDTDPSVAEVVSGIVMAILAVAAWVGTLVVAAVEAIVVAVAAVADGLTDPDWEELRCYVGWTIAYQNNLTNTLHELLSWAGLGFPYTLELTHNDIAFTNSGQVNPADAALNTVLSKGRSTTEPASQWVGPATRATNWANPPTEPPEGPPEFSYPSTPTWPFHFVDGFQPTPAQAGSPAGTITGVPQQINPLNAPAGVPPLVRDPAQFAARRAGLTSQDAIASFFGNAVDVSLDLIRNAKPADFLDWDLTADPGLGFPTWRVPTAASARSALVAES